MEGTVQQLQMNLASSHQKHKTEMSRVEEQVRTFDQDCGDLRRQTKSMEQEVKRKDDIIKKADNDLQLCRKDVESRIEEVWSSWFYFNILNYCSCKTI